MRMSEVLGKTRKENKNKRRLSIALLISGLLSLVIIFVTIYGQYTGMFTISMTNEIHDKGIMLSETKDFNVESEKLTIKPLEDVHDMTEGQLDNNEEAESHDGQYYDPNYDYIAYTFYLKNTGKETVDVNYTIRILSEYKGVGVATRIKVIQSLVLKDDSYIERTEKTFKKETPESKVLASEVINTFQPGEVRKFTIYMWFNGGTTEFDTNPQMVGGAIKLEWVFGIVTAGEDV